MAKHPDYLGKGFATHRNRRLKWDCKLHMIGEKVFDPMIHCCGKCRLPILSYGRMIPCKHVFCFDCAKSTDKVCLRCAESVQRIEQSPLGKIFICTYGGSKHSTDGCRRTYLSQRDLQAHINHRHLRPQQPATQQPAQPQQQAAQQQQQQQQATVQPTKDLNIHSQSRIQNDPRTQSYDAFNQQPPPPAHPQGVAPPATHSQAVAPQQHNPTVPPPTHSQGVPPHNVPPATHNQGVPPPTHNQGVPPPNHNQGVPPPTHNQGVPPPTHNQGVPPPPTHGQMHNPYEEGPDGMSDSPSAQDEYGMGRIQVRKSNLITVPLQDNSAPQHPPPHPQQQHPPQHMPPPVSGYQSNMPPPQPHSVPPPPPPQHAGYPPHGPPIHSTSYAPPPMGTPHSAPQSVPPQQPQPQNPHYSMAPLPPVPPVSHIGGPPPRFHDSGPHPPPFSGPTGPMSSQSPPFQSARMPTSTGPGQWNSGMGPPPPRVIMTQAPTMPAPVPAPGMSHPQSGPPPRPDMRAPPPRTDGRYRAPYFT